MIKKSYCQKPNFKLYEENSLKLLEFFSKNLVDMVFVDSSYDLLNGGLTIYAWQKGKGYWIKVIVITMINLEELKKVN